MGILIILAGLLVVVLFVLILRKASAGAYVKPPLIKPPILDTKNVSSLPPNEDVSVSIISGVIDTDYALDDDVKQDVPTQEKNSNEDPLGTHSIKLIISCVIGLISSLIRLGVKLLLPIMVGVILFSLLTNLIGTYANYNLRMLDIFSGLLESPNSLTVYCFNIDDNTEISRILSGDLNRPSTVELFEGENKVYSKYSESGRVYFETKDGIENLTYKVVCIGNNRLMFEYITLKKGENKISIPLYP